MTMATIINSDMIPFKERGMYQAVQNLLHGFGSICGASLGGIIADNIGWRWCFLLQVPIAIFALVVGYFPVTNFKPRGLIVDDGDVVAVENQTVWKQIDLTGSILLVTGLSAQLAALSMGGNDFEWLSWQVLASLVLSLLLLVGFIAVELRTKAIPIMPMSMFRGKLAVSNILSNVCVGMAAYGVSTQVGMKNPPMLIYQSSCSWSHYSSRWSFRILLLRQACD